MILHLYRAILQISTFLTNDNLQNHCQNHKSSLKFFGSGHQWNFRYNESLFWFQFLLKQYSHILVAYFVSELVNIKYEIVKHNLMIIYSKNFPGIPQGPLLCRHPLLDLKDLCRPVQGYVTVRLTYDSTSYDVTSTHPACMEVVFMSAVWCLDQCHVPWWSVMARCLQDFTLYALTTCQKILVWIRISYHCCTLK